MGRSDGIAKRRKQSAARWAGQGVGAPHSSAEAGERPFRTLWSEGGTALWMGSWNHADDAVPRPPVTARQPDRVRDSDPQRDEPDTSSTLKSGSVGARGGQLPRATRPDLPYPNLIKYILSRSDGGAEFTKVFSRRPIGPRLCS